MMSVEPAVEALGLAKRFDRFTAVDGVSFQVRTGEVFGFLGPNGSGKTTTIRMLCGIIQPNAGKGSVLGLDCWRQAEQVKRRIGYMSQRFALYEELSIQQNMEFYASVYGVARSERAATISRYIEQVGLAGREDERAGGLGGGLRQRLAFACAVVHQPSVLFLDEPTAGVDPVARREFWEVIYKLAAGGTTIFVTTHYMDEAEYCNRLGLMHQGRLIALGTPDDLRRKVHGQVLEIAADPLSRALAVIEAQPWLRDAAVSGKSIRVCVARGVAETLAADLRAKGIVVHRLEAVSATLDEVFLALVDMDRSIE